MNVQEQQEEAKAMVESQSSDQVSATDTRQRRPAHLPKQATHPCQCTPKVLVVDDNQFNIQALKLTISEHFQVEVHEAINGQLAVDKFVQMFSKDCNCPNKNFKVIFMDIQMPVMNGITAAQTISDHIRLNTKEGEQPVQTAIYAVTAYTDQKTKEDCVAAGMKAVFNKPMEFKHLQRIMWTDFYGLPEAEWPADAQSCCGRREHELV